MAWRVAPVLLLLSLAPPCEPAPDVAVSTAEIKKQIRDLLDAKFGYSGPIRWLYQGLGGRWFFNTDDEIHGAELWETDLTEHNTYLLKDIQPGKVGSYPNHLCEFNDHIYFSANDGSHGIELWQTDGTLDGTHIFRDANPGTESSYPQGMTNCGGSHLFYAASDGMVSEDPCTQLLRAALAPRANRRLPTASRLAAWL